MDTTYQFSAFSGITSHWRFPRLFRDQDRAVKSIREVMEIEAEAVSGDLFVTLATRLDEISRSTSDYDVRIYLENIISDLIYLQDNYTIAKNKQPEQIYGYTTRTRQTSQG